MKNNLPDLKTPVGRVPIPGGGPRTGLLELIWEMISAPVEKKEK